MKFGKNIQQNTEAGWLPYYMSYKVLKKIIKSVRGRQAHEDMKVLFFSRVEKELEKVSAFYLTKESEFKVRLATLIEKTKVVQRNLITSSKSSITILKQAFIQYQKDLSKLQILKKYDKQTRNNTKELFLSTQYSLQPFFNQKTMISLSDTATTYSLEIDSMMASLNKNNPISIQYDHADLVENAYSNLEASICANDYLSLEKQLSVFSQISSDVHLIISLLNFSFSKESRKCSELIFTFYSKLLKGATDDINGRSVVHEACILKSVDYLNLCLSHEIPLDTPDFYGRQPLHYACIASFVDGIKILISNNVPLTHVDHDGNTPFIYCVVNGNLDSTKPFMSCHCVCDELSKLCGTHRPLDIACENGHTEIVQEILKTNPTITADDIGFFPLHIASREGHVEICKLLIDYGHPIDVVDKYHSWTPLFHAVSEGHYDCVKYLVENNCQVNIKDENGWDCFTHALFKGHLTIAELLDSNRIKLEEFEPSKFPFYTIFSSKSLVENSPVMDKMGNIEVPDLLLPPPMISPRIYGHQCLQDEYQVSVSLGNFNAALRSTGLELLQENEWSSLKLCISISSQSNFSYNCILPLKDESQVFSFRVKSLKSIFIQFDLYSMFGTKILARGSFLVPENFSSVFDSCPLYDPRLQLLGVINYHAIVVCPLTVNPENSSRIASYWKSHTPIDDSSHSFVTETSLEGSKLISIPVSFTKDAEPWIHISEDGKTKKLSYASSSEVEKTVTQTKIDKINDQSDIFKLLSSGEHFIKLEEFLKFIQNSLADKLLECIYNIPGSPTILLSSFNPDMCVFLNLKQPHFPVLFATYGGLLCRQDRRCCSIENALRFAKSNHFLGILACSEKIVQSYFCYYRSQANIF
ncbi:hypothetical protein O9G_003674 [Rozella allomycis CSF55]|uniref:Uncharacterized protein n=1 Tax=Rozella allomycis (strain CSF55) TaxID=988480 RepID=A0A075B4F5_ROZAC|nr:hypothetical protein O9G_003674 [Rozella allomycis CSF55]|eukprot:EPZ36102.1 hypothetical protein O9G_003674 [Rozella allomycis CSF55]